MLILDLFTLPSLPHFSPALTYIIFRLKSRSQQYVISQQLDQNQNIEWSSLKFSLSLAPYGFFNGYIFFMAPAPSFQPIMTLTPVEFKTQVPRTWSPLFISQTGAWSNFFESCWFFQPTFYYFLHLCKQLPLLISSSVKQISIFLDNSWLLQCSQFSWLILQFQILSHPRDKLNFITCS